MDVGNDGFSGREMNEWAGGSGWSGSEEGGKEGIGCGSDCGLE